MKEKKTQRKYAANLSNKTELNKFCLECGNPKPFEKTKTLKPQNQITLNDYQSQENKKILICSNCGIDSESWGVKPEQGVSCFKSWELLQEESQSGQSLQKNESNVFATYTSKNYFTRHWQGEYSLTQSFWINFIVAGVLFLFLLKIYPEELITSPIHDLYIYIAVYCITLTVITWQIIGVWRSADNHILKTKRKVWAETVKVLMIFGLISTGFMVQELLPGLNKFSYILSRDIDIQVYSIRVMDNKKEVEITGGIKFGLTEALRKTFNKYPTIKVIHLNSYGGRVVEARLLREFIEKMGLITSTNKGCLSACTIAYMGGASRFIYGEKKLGFHRYGLAYNQTDILEKIIVESFTEDKAIFLNKGASNNFMNHIYNTSASDLWFPENDILFANHIITGIAEDTDFLLYQETVLGDNLVYPVITEHVPQILNKNI